VVDALSRIHRSLRPEGVLVDLHPQPTDSAVEVWQEGRITQLGHIGSEADVRDILEARLRLDQVERDGWYAIERLAVFDLLFHFPDVDEWLTYMAENEPEIELPEELVSRARLLLSAAEGELVIREPARASGLRRLPGPGDGHRVGDPPSTGRG
jgi:hypothetical protein